MSENEKENSNTNEVNSSPILDSELGSFYLQDLESNYENENSFGFDFGTFPISSSLNNRGNIAKRTGSLHHTTSFDKQFNNYNISTFGEILLSEDNLEDSGLPFLTFQDPLTISQLQDQKSLTIIQQTNEIQEDFEKENKSDYLEKEKEKEKLKEKENESEEELHLKQFTLRENNPMNKENQESFTILNHPDGNDFEKNKNLVLEKPFQKKKMKENKNQEEENELDFNSVLRQVESRGLFKEGIGNQEQQQKKRTQKEGISMNNLNKYNQAKVLNNQKKRKLKKKTQKKSTFEEGFDSLMLQNLSLKDHKQRKRDLKPKNNRVGSLHRLDSTVIESGKEVFKLLVGQLWVISGGASQKFLSPFTIEMTKKIGEIFDASENETKKFQSQLKYLLSNSRRTFTEFVLEILVALLSLNYSKSEIPEISKQFWNILEEINEFNNENKTKINNNNVNNNKNNETNTNSNSNDTDNNNGNNCGNTNSIKEENININSNQKEREKKNKDKQEQEPEKEKEKGRERERENERKSEKENEKEEENKLTNEPDGSQKLKLKLEQIYQQCFTQKVLMYWFNNRFVDRLNAFFQIQEQQKFFEQHLFFLGKSKFLLSCLLLARELVKREDNIVYKYYQLINTHFNNNILNLYSNNRGKKVKLINQIISVYGLNGGNYWSIISKDYCKKIQFQPKDIFHHFPFISIINNPKLVNLCSKNISEAPLKMRNLVNNENRLHTHTKINENWLAKKKIF
ncbi:fip1-like 1 protein [Anaeramoeba flamelloides]|uniref:Fip1-like 1 protein n=1 Tax=Anaeramoeba flamelloides TaxID=1746091 RepID=A0AAV7ZM73_9EUKA|nr:fip1-like 1 protein [Anaeramoeba flamelloides]